MRGALRPSLLVLGTAAALVGGGSVLAFAGWTSRTLSPTFTIHATKVPQVQKPTVTLIRVGADPAGVETAEPGAALGPPAEPNPKIQWTKVELTPDEAVHRYIITRHAGPVADIVCTLPATKTPVCIDKTAPAGYTLTYTVAATYGTNWVGEDSEPSPAVTMPGTPAVLTPSGVPVASSAAGLAPSATPTRSPTPEDSAGPADPSALPVRSTAGPTTTTSLAPVTTPPVIATTAGPSAVEPTSSAATPAEPAASG